MKAVIQIEGKTYAKFPNLYRNDRGKVFTFTVRADNDTVIDLTGATVRFKMQNILETTSKVNGVCTLTTPTSGLCEYTMQSTDIDTFGVFDAELEVITNTGTKTDTIPFGRVSILQDLN